MISTAKESFGGIARGISAILAKSDASVKNMAELASLFSERMDEVRGMFVTFHDEILDRGLSGTTSIGEVVFNGAYVDDRALPILHDIGVEDVRGYVREMFFAMIINNAWIKQGAYIFSREMDEESCKSLPLLILEHQLMVFVVRQRV